MMTSCQLHQVPLALIYTMGCGGSKVEEHEQHKRHGHAPKTISKLAKVRLLPLDSTLNECAKWFGTENFSAPSFHFAPQHVALSSVCQC